MSSSLSCRNEATDDRVTTVYGRPQVRIAIVTQGGYVGDGGGVTSVVRWLTDSLRQATAYRVEVHELASSSRDRSSRRLASPSTWLRRSLREPVDLATTHWGANAVEIETMRYRPRRELSRCLRDYDLIQVVSGSPVLAAVVRRAGPPVVLQVATTLRWERASRLAAGPVPLRAWRAAMTASCERVETKALIEADMTLVENDVMLDYVRAIGQPNVAKAAPGVDTERFKPSAVGWRSDGYLLSVCRLSEPRKGLDRLVRGYASLVALNGACPPLVLAGLGTLPEPIKQQIVDLGLADRVSVHVNVPAEELPPLYCGASVYVQTSHEEGLGISLLEATASGLPIVSTDSAGSQEIVVSGVTGLLIKKRTDPEIAEEFALCVLKILRQVGPGMAEAARIRCETLYSTRVTLARYVKTYEALVNTQ